MKFQIKSDLSTKTVQELERINAIDSTLRTTDEAAFIAARIIYLTNEVISEDADGLILIAAGNTVPTSAYTGFKKGALFIKKDASANGLYQNIGDEVAANFIEVNRNVLEDETPVNAVKATATITSDATAPADGDTVVIGDITYTFKTALTTDPAIVPYEVLIGESAAVALDNLKLAINKGAGEGTNYSTGTVAHPLVTATTNTNTTQVIEAKTAGVAANEIALSETSDHLTFGEAVEAMSGGVDGTVALEGQTYKDDSYLYVAVAVNTISGANWRRVSLGSAY